MTALTKSTLLFMIVEAFILYLLVWLFEGNPFSASSTFHFTPFFAIVITGIFHHYEVDMKFVDLRILEPTEEHFKRTYSQTIETEYSNVELLALLQRQDWLKDVQLNPNKQAIVAKTQKRWWKIKLELQENTLTISSQSPLPINGLPSIVNIKNVQRIEKLIRQTNSAIS